MRQVIDSLMAQVRASYAKRISQMAAVCLRLKSQAERPNPLTRVQETGCEEQGAGDNGDRGLAGERGARKSLP